MRPLDAMRDTVKQVRELEAENKRLREALERCWSEWKAVSLIEDRPLRDDCRALRTRAKELMQEIEALRDSEQKGDE